MPGQAPAPGGASAAAAAPTGAPAPTAPASTGAPAPAGGVGDAASVLDAPEVPATPVAPEVPAPTTSASFDWDGWDGNGFDSFPEETRDWLTEAARRQEAKAQEALGVEADKSARWQRMFNDSLDGADDPRIQENQTQLDQALANNTELQAQLKQQGVEMEEFRARVDSFVQDNSDNYVEWFKRAYPDISSNDAALDKVMGLADTLGLGSDWDFAAQLYQQGDESMAAAKAGHEAGAPSEALPRWVELTLAAAKKKGPPKQTQSEQLATSDGRPSMPTRREAATGHKPISRSSMDGAIRSAVSKSLAERKRR